MDVIQLTDWLWDLQTPIVQAYAIRHRDGSFSLVDSSTAGQEGPIVDALASIAGSDAADVRIRDIILTHGHDDHTGSAAALVASHGSRVLGPDVDAPYIEKTGSAPPPVLADWEVPLLEQVLPHVPPAPPVTLNERLHDGTVLDLDEPATIVTVPGHTPGSVALWFERSRVLLAGDAIASHEGNAMLGVFNSDPAAARESFVRLAALDPLIVAFGHGEPLLVDASRRLAAVADDL